MARVDVSLTSNEISIVQSISDGTYFVDWYTPTGTINGVNDTFTLTSNPNPDASLEVKLNGAILTVTEDYTLSGITLTMGLPPDEGSLLQVRCRVSPV